MDSTKTIRSINNAESSVNNVEQPVAVMLEQPKPSKIQPPQKKPLTFGQKVADKMATKVGSWAFLIGQSTVLMGWVGCNMIPGLPHWDESPFMMLNLVFSFASAYTAPVVLMSQNRQSEEDRENASHNYQVTLQAAQNLERLHEKLDAEYSQKLDELTSLIKQQHVTSEIKVVFVPSQTTHEFDQQSNSIATVASLNSQLKDTVFVNVASGQSFASDLNLNDAQVLVSK